MTTTTEGTGAGSAEGALRGLDLDNIRKVLIFQGGRLMPCVYVLGSGGNEKYVLRAIGDGQFKIDPTDEPGYPDTKIVAGTNISFVISPGPNKTLTINATGAASGWTDDGTIVRLDTITDDVGIGTVTAEGKTTIITDLASKIPLVLKTAVSQSDYAFAIKDSGGVIRNAISLGSATVTGTLNTNLGANAGIALTTGIQDTFVGESAGLVNSTGSFNAAFGNKALQSNVSGSVNTAIGHECCRDYTGSNSTAVGAGALKMTTTGDSNVAIGANAMHDFGAATNGGSNVAVGRNAMAQIDAGGADNVAIGRECGRRISSGTKIITIGRDAGVGGGALGITTGTRVISIGSNSCATATFTGSNNVVVGSSSTLATAATADATSLGDETTVHTDSIALGRLAATTASNQMVAGSSLHAIDDVYAGKGVTNATPTEYRINGTGGSGSNIAGADLVVAGGKGTGDALPGCAAVKYPLIDASGSTLQSLSSDVFPINTTMFTATATGTVANTITETTILGTGIGTKTLPAGFFRPGRTIRVTVRGIYSNTGTPTLQIQCKLGSTVIGDTGANATVAATNSFFEVSEIFTCRTVGALGTVFAQGMFDENAFVRHPMVNTAATTIDTTVSQVIDVTATWGAADPANTISATNVIIEVLN